MLLVDDQQIVGEAVRRILAGEDGIEFHFCSDANAAIEAASLIQPTVILQDRVMPAVDGLELVRRFEMFRSSCSLPRRRHM